MPHPCFQRSCLPLLAAAMTTLLSTAAMAGDISVHEAANDPMLHLGALKVPGGKTLEMSVGIGSAAFRASGDPADMFWTLSDRGPNLTPDEALEITGVAGETLCGDGGVKGCRIYLAPSYPPSIYRIEVKDDGTFRVLDAVALKTRSGRPVTGLLNPLKTATTENAVDGAGNKLPQDPNSIDAEGIVRLADGTFWIGEENGPSILHVAADGTIQRRIVPDGTEGEYAGADYPVTGGLPAILAKRFTNRGIESMALSGDGRSLYFMMQSPLANPDGKTYGEAANTRIFQIDRETLKPVAEFVYVMDPMSAWPGEEKKKQSTVRISELTWIGDGRLLVDERTDKTGRIFGIDLSGATNILGTRWDDAATSPSLEQSKLGDVGVTPVKKSLILDSAKVGGLPVKVEGVAVFGDGSLMLINDDDFGITGESTKVVRVRGLDLGR